MPRGGCRPLQPTRPTPRWHRRQAIAPAGFGLLPVRSPLLRESSLFLGVLRCFSSPGALSGIAPEVPGRAPGGLPHSDIPGSPAASASPGHFAAWPRPSSAANAKASTMRPSCGYPASVPLRRCGRDRASRPARASGMVPPGRSPRCRTARRRLAPPRGIACCERCRCRVVSVVCVLMQCARASRHEPRPPTGLGATAGSRSGACPVKPGSPLPRPQNPTGSAWRLVKVHETRGRRTCPVARRGLPLLRSSNLVRSRLPTSDELSQPRGGLPTAADVTTLAAPAMTARPPGWSRGDSNPGPPPCKGGALPAKLRPPTHASPHRRQTGRSARPGGRAWTRTRDLGLIRAAL